MISSTLCVISNSLQNVSNSNDRSADKPNFFIPAPPFADEANSSTTNTLFNLSCDELSTKLTSQLEDYLTKTSAPMSIPLDHDIQQVSQTESATKSTSSVIFPFDRSLLSKKFDEIHSKNMSLPLNDLGMTPNSFTSSELVLPNLSDASILPLIPEIHLSLSPDPIKSESLPKTALKENPSNNLPTGVSQKYKVDEIIENPVRAIHDYCSVKRLPKPEFSDITEDQSKEKPIQFFGMEIEVCGKTFSTPVVYTTKKEAKAAASLLGLHSLGFNVNVDVVYNKKRPEPVVNELIDGKEPKTSNADSYFHKLQSLIQRQGLIPPNFHGESVSSYPASYLMTFTFLGQTFKAIDSSKVKARQAAAKKAFDYLSLHPEYSQPPTDYILLLTKHCASKKWPPPRFFDPKDELTEPLLPDQISIAVVANGYTFIEKLGKEYTQVAAKRFVARKAYEYFLSMEAKASTPADTSESAICSESPTSLMVSPSSDSTPLSNAFSSTFPENSNINGETNGLLWPSLTAKKNEWKQIDVSTFSNNDTSLTNSMPTNDYPAYSDSLKDLSNENNDDTEAKIPIEPIVSSTHSIIPSYLSPTLSSSPSSSNSTLSITGNENHSSSPSSESSPQPCRLNMYNDSGIESNNFEALMKFVKKQNFLLTMELVPVIRENETVWVSRVAIYKNSSDVPLAVASTEQMVFKDPSHALECSSLTALLAYKEKIMSSTQTE